ncbi:MAG: EAL domain-containing protein [Bacillota bacterium]|nr:EAL domain-containing protein [Bacillota bacterium]
MGKVKDFGQDLRELYDKLEVGIVIYDVKGDDTDIVYVNKFLCEFITGETMEAGSSNWSYEGKGPSEYVYPKDMKKYKKQFLDSLIGDGEFSEEIRLMRKDGSFTWFKVRIYSLANDGETKQVMVSFDDVDKATKRREELKRRVDYDPLTGIFNKEAFYRHTEKMLKANPDVQYVMIRWEIAKFKMINTLFGSEVGDRVLKKMAEAVKLAEGIGTYGHLEADHFVMCLPLSNVDFDNLLRKDAIDFDDLGISHKIVSNIGVYIIDEPDLPVDQMCDRALMALKNIKGSYKSSFAIYDDEIRKNMITEQIIQDRMDEALECGEFEVYLQPIHSLSHNAVASAEALVRWNYKWKELMSPGIFIPIFERNGFIAQLDMYMFESVCRILKDRKDKGLEEIPISVNASRRTLYDRDFCSKVNAITEKYGVEPHLLKIEITETAYTDNPQQLLEIVNELKEVGYPILMDDFGSGYSSFNILKDIPIDMLKIDLKFLEGFEKGGKVGTILTSVLRMARWLGISVIAEGVETDEQRAFLKSITCDFIQGFVFSKPMPVAEFNKYAAQEGGMER